MKYQLFLKMTLVWLSLTLVHCSRKPENSTLNRIPYSMGTLVVDENADPKITGGVVQYRVYKTGDIFYSGEVSYYSGDTLGEVQVPFQGRYKVKPEDVIAKSYENPRTVIKVSFVPEEMENPPVNSGDDFSLAARVTDFTKVDSPDASGSITIAKDSSPITIKSADLKGTIFYGSPFQTQIRLKLSSVK